MHPFDKEYFDQWDRDDRLHCYLEQASEETAERWESELKAKGIIADIWEEEADLKLGAKEEGVTVYRYLRIRAWDYIRAELEAV